MKATTKTLIVCQIVVILLLSYALVLHGFVTSAAKVDTLLVEAKTYYYTAEIIKSEIEHRLPEKIQNSVVGEAIIAKALDYFVTPKLVQNISKKPIERLITAINKEGNAGITNDKVVIDMANYKSQITQSISGWQLPPGLNNLATESVDSIPSQITIADLEKNPNSFVGYLVKTRAYINKLSNIIMVLVIILIVLITSTFAVNRNRLRKAFQALGWVLGISGILITLLSYLGPIILNSFIYIDNQSTVAALYNNMILKIEIYYVSIPGPMGILFILLGIVIYLTTSPNFIDQIKYLFTSIIKTKTSPKIESAK
ncbi:MAG: hypothetical protein WC437_02310 [Patescibacteria group bacterium]|jgi:hypothetical protein|nr:hypothetical protein [Patescibacteria group bacterium]